MFIHMIEPVHPLDLHKIQSDQLGSSKSLQWYVTLIYVYVWFRPLDFDIFFIILVAANRCRVINFKVSAEALRIGNNTAVEPYCKNNGKKTDDELIILPSICESLRVQ